MCACAFAYNGLHLGYGAHVCLFVCVDAHKLCVPSHMYGFMESEQQNKIENPNKEKREKNGEETSILVTG